jgi:hypothetical protein
MRLPSNLLQAIAAPNGGQVVLILGAGCSVDPPTSLPVGRKASLDAHQKLLDNNVLQPGDCAHPEDLSALADSVWLKTGSQNDLVNSLPRGDFQMAKPNVGYLLAAALLREQSLLAVLTLNFDLAATHALVELGGRDVDVLNGPAAGVPGMTNLIYLHRNANSPNDEWILRTASLEHDWAGRWEELITQRVMTAPYSVFVGLGSPAGVLVASLRRIRDSNVHSTAYVIGRGAAGQSPFLGLLGLPASNYIQSTWQEFMEGLSARVAKDHKTRLVTACEEVRTENGWEAEDVSNLCQRIEHLGLLEMGRLRAIWFLDKDSYRPFRGMDPHLWADMVLILALIERIAQTTATFTDGLLEFMDGNRRAGLIALASGKGTKRWIAIETELQQKARLWEKQGRMPTVAVVTGFVASTRAVAAPVDLVANPEENDIVGPSRNIKMINAYDLRENPELIRGMVN